MVTIAAELSGLAKAVELFPEAYPAHILSPILNDLSLAIKSHSESLISIDHAEPNVSITTTTTGRDGVVFVPFKGSAQRDIG
jgi:hypothetical protein